MPETSDMLGQSKEKLMSLMNNPKVVASLLAGLGTGVAGGALSAGTPKRRGETRGQRRRRILKNALLAGGAGAVATGGAMYGLDQLNNVLPEEEKYPGSGLVNLTGEIAGAGVGAGTVGRMYNNSRKEALKAFLDNAGIKSFSVSPQAAIKEHILQGAAPFNLAYNKGGGMSYDDFLTQVADRGANIGRKGNRAIGGTLKQKGLRALKRHPLAAGAAAGAMLYNPLKYGLTQMTDVMPNISTYGDR
jgi:hypothetical protein